MTQEPQNVFLRKETSDSVGTAPCRWPWFAAVKMRDEVSFKAGKRWKVGHKRKKKITYKLLTENVMEQIIAEGLELREYNKWKLFSSAL